jgi:hypothetical protein
LRAQSVIQQQSKTLMFTAANENGADLTTEATWSASPSTIITIPSTTVTSTTMGTLEGGTGFATVITTVNVTSGSLLLKITQQGLILMILPMSPTFDV